MKQIFLGFVLFFFLLPLGGGGAETAHALTLDQITKEASGNHIPQKILRYKQGAAMGKGETADIYNRRGQQAMSFIGLFQKMIDYLALVIASVAILMIVINGLRITYSGGGEELNKAKTALLWSAGGLGMITFSYIITKTVISLTYIN